MIAEISGASEICGGGASQISGRCDDSSSISFPLKISSKSRIKISTRELDAFISVTMES